MFKSICQNQFAGNLFHIQVIAKGKKIAYTFYNFTCKSHIFGVVWAFDSIKILPGPMKAFNCVRLQTPSCPSLSILWTSWASSETSEGNVRLRVHLKPVNTLLEPWGYWTESKSFSEEPLRRGYFGEFLLPASSKECGCTLCSCHECFRRSRDSPLQGALQGF